MTKNIRKAKNTNNELTFTEIKVRLVIGLVILLACLVYGISQVV